MKCPTCGYNSFDHLDTCKKCGSELKGDQRMRPLIHGGEEDEYDYEPLGKSMPEDRSEKGSIADELLNIPINDRPDPPGHDTDGGPPNFRRKEHREQMDLFHESEEAEEASNKSAGEKPDLVGEEGSPEDWLPEHTGGADKYRDPFTEEERYTESERRYNEPGTDVYNLAGFFPRAAAFAVDIGIIFVVAYVTLKIGLFVAGAGSQNAGYLFPALFVLASTYFIFLHALSGKTIGKMLMKIRVINSEGEDLGVWGAFLRWVGYFISAAVMFAGFFWAAFDSEGQAWHDKIAGTYVVKD